MYFSTVESLGQSTGVMNERDFRVAERLWKPSIGEYFNASAAQAFDRTLGRRVWENVSAASAEAEAMEAGPIIRYATEEEYKKSDHYRPGIKYVPNMSAVLAGIYAENYDKRRKYEKVIRAGDENGPWWYAPVGFGAGVIGSLPDPINLIPFGGAALTGVRLAGMTGKQVALHSLRVGAIEGAAGNLISSSFAAWDLNQKGENITAQDVFVDTMFGAVAGPLFHGAGSFISRGRARGVMQRDIAQFMEGLGPESKLFDSLNTRLEGMRAGSADAYANSTATWQALDRAGINDALRRSTSPEDRLTLAQAMEKSIHDMVFGDAVDVGDILRGSRFLNKAEAQLLVDALGDPKYAGRDIDFGTLDPSYKAALNEIRTAEGERPFTSDNLVLPAAVVRKLAEQRVLGDKMTANEVAEMLLQVFHLDPDAAASTRYPHIQAMVRLRDKLAEIGFLGIDSQNRTVIKSVYREKIDRLDKRLGNKGTAPEGRPTPSSGSVENGLSRQPGRLTDHRSGLDTNTIRTGDVEVNTVDPVPALEMGGVNSPPEGDAGGVSSGVVSIDELRSAIDWRTETPENFPRLGQMDDAQAVAGDVDIERLAMLEREGLLTQGDIDLLRPIQEEKAEIEAKGEAALEVVECIMEVIE